LVATAALAGRSHFVAFRCDPNPGPLRVHGEGHYREPIQGADANVVTRLIGFALFNQLGSASFPGADSRRI